PPRRPNPLTVGGVWAIRDKIRERSSLRSPNHQGELVRGCSLVVAGVVPADQRTAPAQPERYKGSLWTEPASDPRGPDV
ncbi:MAG TPA: hypothetical protein VGE52_01385, partial [Pirellulales bacterium]